MEHLPCRQESTPSHLDINYSYLLHLCANWQSSTDAELWGPTAAELLDARMAAVQASVTRVDNEVDDLDDDDLKVEEEYWSDDGLVEVLETLQLADGFQDLMMNSNTIFTLSKLY